MPSHAVEVEYVEIPDMNVLLPVVLKGNRGVLAARLPRTIRLPVLEFLQAVRVQANRVLWGTL